MEVKTINGRVVLTASDGKIVTDGKHYCKKIMLEAGLSSEGFYEITEEEYEAMQPKVEEEIM